MELLVQVVHVQVFLLQVRFPSSGMYTVLNTKMSATEGIL